MACFLPLPEVSPGGRGWHISRSPWRHPGQGNSAPEPVLSFWLTSHLRQISLTLVFTLFIGCTGFLLLSGLSQVMISKGYSCFPVWTLTSGSPSFLYAFLPQLHRCLLPYFCQIPGAQLRPPALSTQLRVGGGDWMKSRKGETNMGQRVWEDCTEEKSLA